MTLFSRAHAFGFIYETLFLRLFISCTIILTWEILAWTLFSRVTGLANLRENKVLANKKCFTVYKWHMIPEFMMRYFPRFRLLNKVTWDYRGERWFTLLASILEIWVLYLSCRYLPRFRLLNKVIWDYRGERWFTLLASILEIWIIIISPLPACLGDS